MTFAGQVHEIHLVCLLYTSTGLNGMYHLNGLLTVCGKDLVYTPDDGGAVSYTHLLRQHEAW